MILIGQKLSILNLNNPSKLHGCPEAVMMESLGHLGDKVQLLTFTKINPFGELIQLNETINFSEITTT